MSRSFSLGGIHPPQSKHTRALPVEPFPVPETVAIPLVQHIGAPAVPVVAKGDRVKVGQLIGRKEGFVSANVHSSVSGTVVAIDELPDMGGIRRPSVTIQVEGDQWDEAIDRSSTLVRECALAPQQIVEKIAAAGIVGMGGATFPTHVKLSPPPGRKIDTLIINGVECEPCLTSDHRLMLERGEEMIVGVMILARALGVERSYIAIEENKPDAIAHLGRMVADYPGVEVMGLRVRYPQGSEKQLIEAVARRRVPSCGLPSDVGVVVQNVGTALAVYEAVQKDKPLIERIITVGGEALPRPGNFLVRVGTPIGALIDHCGGMEGGQKIISGGPMMGRAVSNPAAPVAKGTSGIVVMPDAGSRRSKERDCIKCARCVSVCPMGLEPYLLIKMVRMGRSDQTEEQRILDCVECGSCAYACPSKLPLLDFVRMGKGEAMRLRRQRQQACKRCD
ncbi:electron transport complex subunit C [Bacteroidia bacterium]|nr:electron transport complex subunit C [Bacteroidia bacterium]